MQIKGKVWPRWNPRKQISPIKVIKNGSDKIGILKDAVKEKKISCKYFSPTKGDEDNVVFSLEIRHVGEGKTVHWSGKETTECQENCILCAKGFTKVLVIPLEILVTSDSRPEPYNQNSKVLNYDARGKAAEIILAAIKDGIDVLHAPFILRMSKFDYGWSYNGTKFVV